MQAKQWCEERVLGLCNCIHTSKALLFLITCKLLQKPLLESRSGSSQAKQWNEGFPSSRQLAPGLLLYQKVSGVIVETYQTHQTQLKRFLFLSPINQPGQQIFQEK